MIKFKKCRILVAIIGWIKKICLLQSHATSTQSNWNNSVHPHGLSYANQRSSNKPNDSEQFEMYKYDAKVIVSKSIDKQIIPTKNLQSLFTVIHLLRRMKMKKMMMIMVVVLN